jgi:hypothetical protein
MAADQISTRVEERHRGPGCVGDTEQCIRLFAKANDP